MKCANTNAGTTRVDGHSQCDFFRFLDHVGRRTHQLEERVPQQVKLPAGIQRSLRSPSHTPG